MSYSEMLAHLYSLQDLRGIRFGLAGIRKTLRRLGDPQKRYLCVHVVGTKGKGSSAAMLHSILGSAGYRTGLYTSPHLLDFRERFALGGLMAEPNELLAAYEEIRSVTGGGGDPPLTFFEWCTAMALLVFARRRIEVAILEAGMGGRLDATRAAAGRMVLVSLIGLDHQAYLGRTRREIAGEKAGIIPRGALVLTGRQFTGVSEVIDRRAAAVRARVVQVEKEADLCIHGTDVSGVSFDLKARGRRLPRLFSPLPGRHQARNAALAVLGALCLEEMGFRVADEAIRVGLARCRWPGRLEVRGEDPPVILDAAHNPDSMESLVAFLDDVFPGAPLRVVMGVLADKDVRGMLSVLPGRRTSLFLGPCRSPRTAGPATVSEQAAAAGVRVEGVFGSVAEALEAALARGASEGPVVVTGSLFTVAEASAFLDGKPAESFLQSQ